MTPGDGAPPPLAAAACRLAPVLGWISRIALWLSAGGLLSMTLIVGWHVFARRVLNDTPHWSETGSVLIMFWYSLIGAAIGVRYRQHIGLVVIRDALPAGLARALGLFSHGVVAAFGLALLVYGSQMVATTWSQTIPTVGLPTGLRYLPFPLAGALMILFSAELAVRDLARPVGPSAGRDGEWS